MEVKCPSVMSSTLYNVQDEFLHLFVRPGEEREGSEVDAERVGVAGWSSAASPVSQPLFSGSVLHSCVVSADHPVITPPFSLSHSGPALSHDPSPG